MVDLILLFPLTFFTGLALFFLLRLPREHSSLKRALLPGIIFLILGGLACLVGAEYLTQEMFSGSSFFLVVILSAIGFLPGFLVPALLYTAHEG